MLLHQLDRLNVASGVSVLLPKPGVNDAAVFSQFCESNLGVKSYVDERGVRRVGSASPQKLVVTLLSEHTSSDVLRLARQLRHSTDDSVKQVYINPDLSPEQAKAAYERRCARRRERSNTAGPPTVNPDLNPSATPFLPGNEH